MSTSFLIDNNLVRKYNLPVPRYTSYPTVPYWKEQIDVLTWTQTVAERFVIENNKEGISIYIHLPFCESLCTYCGCNKKITTNHSVEEVYIKALEKEWKLYCALMQEKPVIRELHLGGGTPTFFSAGNLQKILDIVLKNAVIHPQHAFSIEGHPNNTTAEQLQVLFENGFTRISYGVQDNDPEVQRVINRIQPFSNLQKATNDARVIGFTSVNFDLIYGLPLQTLTSIEKTINQVMELMPDRIAYYSYAHVPWTSKAQRLFNELDLPSGEEKLALYLKGKELLLSKGYIDIGMDHFALPHDELHAAKKQGNLHRSFMGYTTQPTGLLIGLGVSSISDAGIAFSQNEKTLHDYYERINQGELPIVKGYFLTGEDVIFRKHILNISCRERTTFTTGELSVLQQYTFPVLARLQADGLVIFNERECVVTETGQYFIRNICSAFDLHLQKNKVQSKAPMYSKAM
ncbi:MAG: oxygen-independent coproporphyrinogen III oxidase [Bacteroidota bacterium]